MNPLETFFAEIESHQFSALVNIASNLKTFLRTVREQPQTRAVAAAIQQAESRERLFTRIENLAAQDCDPDYEHPADAALATYLWLLSGQDPELAARAARLVQECPGTWWAKRVAEDALATTADASTTAAARTSA